MHVRREGNVASRNTVYEINLLLLAVICAFISYGTESNEVQR